jgi:hypothetical protein
MSLIKYYLYRIHVFILIATIFYPNILKYIILVLFFLCKIDNSTFFIYLLESDPSFDIVFVDGHNPTPGGNPIPGGSTSSGGNPTPGGNPPPGGNHPIGYPASGGNQKDDKDIMSINSLTTSRPDPMTEHN